MNKLLSNNPEELYYPNYTQDEKNRQEDEELNQKDQEQQNLIVIDED